MKVRLHKTDPATYNGPLLFEDRDGEYEADLDRDELRAFRKVMADFGRWQLVLRMRAIHKG